MLRSYYRETIWARWWYWTLFIGIIAIHASILVFLYFFELPAGLNPVPGFALVILLVVVSMMSIIFVNFLRLSIDVNSENIRVSYGLIRKTISLDDVVSCEPTTGKLRVYGGVGVRLGTDGSLAFTTSTGSAVKITRRRGRPFVFSAKNPVELSKIINEVSKERGSKLSR